MPHEPEFDVTKAHRWFAVCLNNSTWEWLESPDSDEDETKFLHAAHASCYHWMQVGNSLNLIRALCLVCNVESRLGHSESALQSAGRCVELLATTANVTDWDQAFACDALARAEAAAGQSTASQTKQRARKLGDAILDPEDKAVFDRWHAIGEWHGLA